MRKKVINKILSYFFRGALFVAPVAFSALVIEAVFNWLDGLLPFKIPGLGILIILAGIVGIGYLASTLLMKPVFDAFESFIRKIPLLSLIYTSIKDLVGAFVGDKKKFNEPVIVKMNRDSDVYKPGFITQSDLTALDMEGYVSVYLPHSYNFSGNIYIVPNENVRKWDVSATEAMKFIVSGGVTGYEDIEEQEKEA